MKNIKRGIFMLAMIFALLWSAQPVDARNKTYVVVVGVDNQNTLFGVPAATAKRAAKFYRHTQNAEVFLLLEKNATRDNILRVMRNMFSRADNQDASVFVYDGHGYCTSSWAAGGVSTIDKSAGGIGYDEIQTIMKNSRAKRKMAFVSACYSGGITYPKREKDNTRRGNAKADVMIYSSTPGDQTGLIGSDGSDFLAFVIDGMEGAADANGDRKVTARELFNYANPKTIERFNIHPQMWGNFNDNMVVSIVP